MGKNASNIKIGDVDVYFDKNDGNGERDLGHTKGGVTFIVEREFADLMADKYGSMSVDKALTGQKLKVKAMLAEATTENLSVAVAEGEFAENGTDSKLGIGRDSGFLLSSVAGQLRLHPRKNAPSDRNEDIYLWKAVSVEAIELPYKIDEQRVLEITFEALVDESHEDGERLGRVGDAAIS